jgi:hypothetical protein
LLRTAHLLPCASHTCELRSCTPGDGRPAGPCKPLLAPRAIELHALANVPGPAV